VDPTGRAPRTIGVGQNPGVIEFREAVCIGPVARENRHAIVGRVINRRMGKTLRRRPGSALGDNRLPLRGASQMREYRYLVAGKDGRRRTTEYDHDVVGFVVYGRGFALAVRRRSGGCEL